MAQANYTPIQLYRSTSATAEPTAGNLADGELAINTADGKLFYKNSGGAVRLLSIGYGSSTVTPTNGGVQYGTGSALALTAAGSSGQILRSNGAAAPTWENLSALGVSTISFGTTGLTPNSATSGAVTVAGTLATTNGGTGLTSFTANQVFYASSTSAVAQSSNLQFSGTDLTVYGLTVGRGAGAVSTNTAVGASALAANTTANNVVAIGNSALPVNTTGIDNVAVGSQAMFLNTTGANNTATGRQALYSNTTGGNNTAYGYGSLISNTTASNNTAVGYQAGYSNVTGTQNTYVGTQASYTSTSSYNTAVGYKAAFANTTGQEHTAIGRLALTANTTGSEITAVGAAALTANTTGSFNTALGNNALSSNTTASNNTAVGYQAGYSNTTGGVTVLGYKALFSNVTGAYNTAVGEFAGNALTSSASTFVGYYVGRAATTGTDNVGVGGGNPGSIFPTLYNLTTGSYNTGLGNGALANNTTASNNTAVGYQAGYSNTTAGDSTFVGRLAGYGATGQFNTAIGSRTLETSGSGTDNTALGYGAGNSLTTGSFNTFLGRNAGASVSTGSKNTIVGYYNGNQGGLDIRTASNYVVLSDGDGNPLVSTADNQTVALEGAVPNSGTGITFPATQSASSNANTLDDYEEGTWSPVITDATYDATMAAGTFGRYTKIGRLVTCQIYVETTSLGSLGPGNIYISGWPFSIDKSGGGCFSFGGGLNITANQSVTLRPWGSTLMLLSKWDAATGTSAMVSGDWSADGSGYVTVSYEV